MVCETLPPSSPQHSTSRNNGFLSTQRCSPLSNRCGVEATRNLVTLPLAVRLRCGGLTTFPTTVMTVSLDMALLVPGSTGTLPGCSHPRRGRPAEPPPAAICGQPRPLWTTTGAPSEGGGQPPACEDAEVPRTAQAR